MPHFGKKAARLAIGGPPSDEEALGSSCHSEDGGSERALQELPTKKQDSRSTRGAENPRPELAPRHQHSRGSSVTGGSELRKRLQAVLAHHHTVTMRQLECRQQLVLNQLEELMSQVSLQNTLSQVTLGQKVGIDTSRDVPSARVRTPSLREGGVSMSGPPGLASGGIAPSNQSSPVLAVGTEFSGEAVIKRGSESSEMPRLVSTEKEWVLEHHQPLARAGSDDASERSDDTDTRLRPPVRTKKSIAMLADKIFGDMRQMTIDGKFFKESEEDAVLETNTLDTVVGLLVLLNTVLVITQLQYVGYESAIILDVQQEDHGWHGADDIFPVLEHVFNAIYIAELLFRIVWWSPKYFYSFKLLWFDTAIVVVGSLDLYILTPLDNDLGSSVNILRLVRVLKVLRALKVARMMSLFGELRVLVTTVLSCFRALLWSMVLLGMIMTMSGMFMCQFLSEFVRDESNDYNHRMWVWRYYGSSFRAIYTMFEITLSGCWPNYVRPILDHVSPWYAVFFILYVAGVVFAVIRIITALFLKRTMQIASQDEDLMTVEKLKEKDAYLRKLKVFFEAADQSGDGAIDIEEFQVFLDNPKVRSWFQLLGLEFHEASHLFQLLDDGDGLITIDEFIKGLMRLKGHSWSIDVVSLQREVGKLQGMLEHLATDFETVYGIGKPMKVKWRRRKSRGVASRAGSRAGTDGGQSSRDVGTECGTSKSMTVSKRLRALRSIQSFLGAPGGDK